MRYTRRAMGSHGDDPPWRDTMQVCLEGDVITDKLKDSPHSGKAHCPKDGSETISDCPTCNKPIPGKMHYFGVFSPAPLPPAPERCEHCGAAFPWTGKAAKAGAKSSAISVHDVLQRVFDRFPLVARQLRQRHDARSTLDVADEYDVQDLLHSLFRIWWDDVREEEWTPSYAGKAARVDFFLPTESCVVEVKMARKGLTHKELGDELLIDIARYSHMAGCTQLHCFVYDPHGYIKNPRGVEADLEKAGTETFKVNVSIRPR